MCEFVGHGIFCSRAPRRVGEPEKTTSGLLTGKIILTFIVIEGLPPQTHPVIFYETRLYLSITSISGDF
jgi:hypothetical protein